MIFQRFSFGLMLILSEAFATSFLVDSQEGQPFKHSVSSNYEGDLFENSQVSQCDQNAKESSDDEVELFEKSQVIELEEQFDPIEGCDQTNSIFKCSQELFSSSPLKFGYINAVETSKRYIDRF